MARLWDDPEYRKRSYRELREVRKRLGRCMICGDHNDRPGKSRCSKCFERDRERLRRMRQQRREAGLCVRCGKVKTYKGAYYCSGCARKHAQQRRTSARRKREEEERRQRIEQRRRELRMVLLNFEKGESIC